MTLRRRQPMQSRKPRSVKTQRAAYTLVTRRPDGRLHDERFENAALYRARLRALEGSSAESVSIDDILNLLDA